MTVTGAPRPLAALWVEPRHVPDRRVHEPVTVGVPFPRGVVTASDRLTLHDDREQPVPLDATVIERWSDQSVRWALLDFQVVGEFARPCRYQLNVAAPATPCSHGTVAVAEIANGLVVDTGTARFVVGRGEAIPFRAVAASDGRPLLGPDGALHITFGNGRAHRAVVHDWAVAHRGQLRSVIQLRGHAGRRRERLEVFVELQFFAATAAVRVAVTLRNPRRARHPGGRWELGDPGSILFDGAALRLPSPGPILHLDVATDLDSPAERTAPPVEIYQDSSGGPAWRHITHVNRHGRVPQQFRGYQMRIAGEIREGLRATPAITARHADGDLGVACEHFWQNCPMALAAHADAVILRTFPDQFADLHELQGGEQKTHRCVLIFGNDETAVDARLWGRAPAHVHVPPEWYAASEAHPFVSPAGEDADARYRTLVAAGVEGADSFAARREVVDEYGWRHFGDLYADHENAFSGLSEPIVSHYNNQYDAIAGFAIQYMRTGDSRWQTLMNELAAHVCDIDVYHTDRDKSAYNHGLFWHTAHYVPAGRSAHRSFPRHPRVHGGGPSNEHNYTSGLRLHWLMTGSLQSRDTAIELAEWVLAMDDGRRTPWRLISPAPTGLASQTQSTTFHGPGRGAGNSILALLDGHRLTGEARFLSAAETLIRRCIHPGDDITARELLDAERRWSYVVFLQVLGRYLDIKRDLGQHDDAYAYARAALLHYARWMTDHEYPYLDRPDILEYPTETWAAQDLRKSDVFLYAAGHGGAAWRARFLERAQFFFTGALTTLSDADTRALARPLVLVLSNGYMAAGGRGAVPRPAPPHASSMVVPAAPPFVAQKRRVTQRLTAAAAAMAASALVVWWLWMASGPRVAESLPERRLPSAHPASESAIP